MRRVSRQSCEDGPLLEEQETEGQRQLHGLLLQQLHTDVDIQRCVAKRKCFAPSSLYRPFGEQAAGVRSLSQFRALQDGETELAGLRELGLTDAEIQLWRDRDGQEAAEKPHGVRAAPGAKQQRLRVITDKIEARAELMSRPQRFAASRPLSRREMEIEQALFQGNDRLGFLAALYHRDEDNQDGQQGVASSDPMDTLYRDVLMEDGRGASLWEDATSRQKSSCETAPDQALDARPDGDQSEDTAEPGDQRGTSSVQPPAPVRREQTKVAIDQPIGRLRGAAGAGSEAPLTLGGDIESITDQEILQNRESDEVIRSIPRFRNYQAGESSKVLCVKNLSAHATLAQLVALFSRFEPENGPAVVYRLLTGRMKGQAFVTLPDTETAQNALLLVHGYRLLGKPLVVEFGRERRQEETRKEEK